jgi:pimeloyl-ACP methyl ester carboxylesterase
MLRRTVPLVCCLVFASLALARAEDGSFDSNGVKIHYIVEGTGEPVILVHGFTADIDKNWRAPGIIRALLPKYQVIALDNRGHGKSDKPHDPQKYGLEMAEDVVRLMDHLKIKQAHVIGYSMGAIITAKLLTTHPDRLKSAVLGGHSGIREGSPTQFYEELATSLEQGKGIMPLVVRLTPVGQPKLTEEQARARSAMVLKGNDKKALAAVARGFRDLMVRTDKLEGNQVPTLAIVGELDPLKEGVDALQGQMGNLKVVIVKGGDHLTTLMQRQFIQGLQDFLASQTAGKLRKAG